MCNPESKHFCLLLLQYQERNLLKLLFLALPFTERESQIDALGGGRREERKKEGEEQRWFKAASWQEISFSRNRKYQCFGNSVFPVDRGWAKSDVKGRVLWVLFLLAINKVNQRWQRPTFENFQEMRLFSPLKETTLKVTTERLQHTVPL